MTIPSTSAEANQAPSKALVDVRGKTAVVTGATGLLGRQHCLALRDAGARVAVCDLSESASQSFAAELGQGAIGIGLDVTRPDSLEYAKNRVLETWGQLDVLVNNAAINDQFENPTLATELSRFERYPLEMWRKMLDVNVTGMFLCSQVMGTVMAEAGRGSIINIASTYGIVAPDQTLYLDPEGRQKFFKSAAYPATKGAVIAFTRFLAAYWGPRGVRVNTLSPGGVENGQDEYFVQNYARKTPLGRMARPEDYRGAIVYLASDASSYVTGSNLVVDGGWTIW